MLSSDRRRQSGALFVACLAAIALNGCAAAEAPPSESPSSSNTAPPIDPAERISFGRWGAGENRDLPPLMWTANADGSDAKPIGSQHGWYQEWSPDRTMLTFDFADDKGVEQIGTIRPDGSGFTQLTDTTLNSADPAYSPDGTLIVYDISGDPGDPGDYDLWVMNHDGSNAHALLAAADDGIDWEPVFSPHGAQIAFTRDQETAEGLVSAVHVVNADGTGLRALTPFADYVEHPRWSPDGSTIIYNVEAKTGGGIDEPRNGIWTVPVSGGEPQQILPTDERFHYFKPSYSPDGSRLLLGCAHRENLNEDLCVANADGTGIDVIIKTPEYENHGVWY